MAITIVSEEELLGAAGRQFGPGPWLEVGQQRINEFADCTEDHQFIHVDLERAAATPFGGTIAHGLLTLSLLPKLVAELGVALEHLAMGVNYGFDKVRFLAPVRSGKRVRAQVEILSVDRKDAKRYLIKQSVKVEIEGEETPALIAEWLTMLVAA